MILGRKKNSFDYDKLHQLFKDYQVELEKVLNGIIDKNITTKEINKSFKRVDKMKTQIRSVGRLFNFNEKSLS